MTPFVGGERTPAPRDPDIRSAAALPASFFARPTLEVARDLIGKVLEHHAPDGFASGIIVETEAYIGEDDPACHAAAGLTPRTAPLYGPPGLAYVYFNYGMHYLVNAVTEREGFPAACLIRALEPLDGVALMHARRRLRRATAVARESDLCRGPANLAQALAIDLRQNQWALTSSPLRVVDRGFERGPIAWSPRIGIRLGVEHPWRAFARGNRCVSASWA